MSQPHPPATGRTRPTGPARRAVAASHRRRARRDRPGAPGRPTDGHRGDRGRSRRSTRPSSASTAPPTPPTTASSASRSGSSGSSRPARSRPTRPCSGCSTSSAPTAASWRSTPIPSEPCVAADPLNFAGEDTNSTALAVQALTGVGADDEAEDALAFLDDARNKDGGWPYIPGGDSDPNSTGVVLMAFSTDGDAVDQDAVDYLASFQVGVRRGRRRPGRDRLALLRRRARRPGHRPGRARGRRAEPARRAGLDRRPGSTTPRRTPARSTTPTPSTVAGLGLGLAGGPGRRRRGDRWQRRLGCPQLRLHADRARGGRRASTPASSSDLGSAPKAKQKARTEHARRTDRREPRRPRAWRPSPAPRSGSPVTSPASRRGSRPPMTVAADRRPVTEPDPEPGRRLRRRRRAAGHRHEHRPDADRGRRAPRAARHRAWSSRPARRRTEAPPA